MKKLLSLFLVLSLLLAASAALADDVRKLPIELGTQGAKYTARYSVDLAVYEDPSIRVERGRVPSEEFVCTYYWAKVKIADASQLRTEPADGKNFASGHKAYPEVMSKRVRAVLAINGDFTANFSQSKSYTYVLRQGQVFRDTVDPNLDMLLIDESGDFHVLTREMDLENIDKTQIDGKQVINAFQFGPALIVDGQPVADEVLTDYSRSPTFSEPDRRNERMCICQIGDLEYMCIAVSHWGASLPTMRDIALTLAPDCRCAYMLDGGASANMIFLQKKINHTEGGEHRLITDIIYFASANFDN